MYAAQARTASPNLGKVRPAECIARAGLDAARREGRLVPSLQVRLVTSARLTASPFKVARGNPRACRRRHISAAAMLTNRIFRIVMLGKIIA